MLKALLKVNAAAFVNWLAGSGKRGNKGKSSKGKMIVYALLMLYALGVFCWLFGEIFALLAPPLYNAGCGWLYFVYVFIVAFALMFVFSVFAAKNRLYEAKDNDLLLAMPIPPSVILASRMALLLAMNVLFGAIVVGPAIYRWYEIVPFSLGSLVCMIVEFLGLCLFSLALSALLGREASRFFSSSTCIVNNGIGIVFIILAAVLILIYGSDIRSFMNWIMIPTDLAVCAGTVAVAMMAGIIVPTSSSVSLEGKSIWVIQSMPVDPAQVLLGKLKLSLILFLPPVAFCMAALVIVFGSSAAVAVPALLLSVGIVVVMAEIGLIINVNHPLLNWTSETQAVKSSGSILISMVVDMVIVFTLGFGGYLLLDNGVEAETLLTVAAVVMLVAARLLYGVIIGKSARKFAFLS